MKRTYEFKTKSARIEAEYSATLQDEIAYADGYNINIGKEVVKIENYVLYVDGKFVDCGMGYTVWEAKDIYRISKGKHNYKAVRIGNRYVSTEVEEIIQFLQELKKDGTAQEVIDFNNKKAADKLAKEIAENEEIVRKAECQDKIPTDSEYRAWARTYNNVVNGGGYGYVPEKITREQYEEAKKFLKERR